MSYENVPTWIREIPEHFKTLEISNQAFDIEHFHWRMSLITLS